MGKTKPVWMVALQSAANDMGVQLEKGWADQRAQEARHRRGIALDLLHTTEISIFQEQGRRMMREYKAEEQAEEDTLP